MAISASLKKRLMEGYGLTDAEITGLTEAQAVQVSVAMSLRALASFTKNGLTVTDVTQAEEPPP